MVAKAALEVAVHAQPLLVVTPIEALAPMLAMLSAVVDSANVHAVVGGVGVGEDGDRSLRTGNADHHQTRNAIGKRRLMDRVVGPLQVRSVAEPLLGAQGHGRIDSSGTNEPG